MRNKILVTGAGGFLGGHMVRRLLDNGETVIATDLKEYKEWYHDFSKEREQGRIIIDDRRNLRLLLPSGMFQDSHTIYHFAANTGGSEYLTPDKNLSAAQNGQIDLNVFGMAEKTRVDRLFYASCAPPVEGANQGLYIAKAYGENLCKFYNRERGTKFIVARLHNVYGPFDHFRGKRAHVVPVTCRKVLEAVMRGREIVIRGTGNDVRSYVYVGDAISLILEMVEREVEKHIEIGHSESHSVNNVLSWAMKAAGVEFLPTYDTSFSGERFTVRTCNVSGMQEELSGLPATSLEEGVRKTYDWIKDQVSFDTE